MVLERRRCWPTWREWRQRSWQRTASLPMRRFALPSNWTRSCSDGDDSKSAGGAGSRSPLVLFGLVCSGANLPETPNRGVLTAEAIVGLDLRKMNLAVLSACESGLGESAGGEGVYGLVRAFHIAGTRNVAASLWKVEDEATAALMVLFYRHP